MKPERIQQKLNAERQLPETVADFLEEHLAWRAEGSRLARDYHFTSARVAAAFVRYVVEVAAELDRTCAFELNGADLRLELAEGTLEDALELAEAISRAS